MLLSELLEELRTRRLTLTFNRRGSLTLFEPGAGIDVPLSIRRAIRVHSRALQAMIARSDIRTCCSPGLHRSEWDYRNKRWLCNACERLWEEVS